MNKEIICKIKKSLDPIARMANLTIMDSEQSRTMGGGAWVVYSNGAFSMMVVKSRDGVIYYFRDGDWQKKKWYSLDVIYNYLEKNSEYENFMPEKEREYIELNIYDISRIFDPSVFKENSVKLKNILKSREKKLFGKKRRAPRKSKE